MSTTSGATASRITPQVEEASAIEVVCPTGQTTVIITDMPSIHAETVDVVVTSDEDISAQLVNKAAYGKLALTSTLGTVTGGNTNGYVYGQAGTGPLRNPVGVSCSLQIVNSSGSDATVTAWLCARS